MAYDYVKLVFAFFACVISLAVFIWRLMNLFKKDK